MYVLHLQGVYLMGLRSIQNVNVSMCIYGFSFILNVFLEYISVWALGDA